MSFWEKSCTWKIQNHLVIGSFAALNVSVQYDLLVFFSTVKMIHSEFTQSHKNQNSVGDVTLTSLAMFLEAFALWIDTASAW